MHSMPKLYFVDDEPAIRDSVEQAMLIEGIDIVCFPNAIEALKKINTTQAGIVITDIHMPVMDGIQLTQKLLSQNPHFQVIVLTGHGDVQTAVSAMKAGAYDFLEKPFVVDALLTAVKKAADKLALVEENNLLRKELAMQNQVGPKLIGQSPSMQALRRELITLDTQTHPLLLFVGDLGTGKRVTAQYTHDLHSHQTAELFPIAAFNLPRNNQATFYQFVVQLFNKHQGGTLYIHETETLTSQQWHWLAALKPTLLRENSCKTNATCIIIATTIVPTTIVGEFRRFDLLTLAQRTEDIGSLFKHFARGAASRYQLPPPVITEKEIQRLIATHWTENIRQLRQHAELRVLTQIKQPSLDGDTSEQSDADERDVSIEEQQRSLNQRTDSFEQIILIEALHRHQGRLKEVQQELQVSRKTLYDKLRKHQLDKTDFKNR
ncbi:Two-component system C4-dicarboxylate transport response regulator DctD [Vibrio crassostreae]|nr:two-component system C4-dicarboxylate transport response regulator DctD [Vibrio crassostreae]CAK2512981.1 Two-component system C4-dicarboxylate transport response regulator DctD [Vibrio crassostreae]CAK2517084.1 Two-component system C4-dicarboxylate transport response regulator DctD [Vibrio crassostreae]CAK3049903.1 Two-component system C4-dicarboxylate transport response regulator DctD [Vibrio crassostreae]CAK3566269.1 Two-component system C4-dicarboxylate transport response regulator DctD 